MIITSLREWNALDTVTPIYVALTPELNIFDTMYTFNLTANPKKYYPIVKIKKFYDDGMEFTMMDIGRWTSFDFHHDELYEHLNTYEKTHVHSFIIGTSEREVLKEYKDSIINFMETLKRAQLTTERFDKDLKESLFIQDYQKDYPEDWI